MVERGALREGVAALLSFHCLLRVGELVNIRKADVAVREDDRLGLDRQPFEGALRLRATKTGPNQWVSIVDPDVMTLLNFALVGLRPEDKVFPFSAASFRKLLRSVSLELGIRTPYVPHSFRHGGATRLHMLGISIEDIMLRGRWQSSKSARRYIQSGQALLLAIQTPSQVVNSGRIFAADLLAAVDLACAVAQRGSRRGGL